MAKSWQEKEENVTNVEKFLSPSFKNLHFISQYQTLWQEILHMKQINGRSLVRIPPLQQITRGCGLVVSCLPSTMTICVRILLKPTVTVFSVKFCLQRTKMAHLKTLLLINWNSPPRCVMFDFDRIFGPGSNVTKLFLPLLIALQFWLD